MSDDVRLTLAQAGALCRAALLANRSSESNAASTAAALVRAEADGQQGHGLSRVPSYAAQSNSGKVDGYAEPQVEQIAAGLLRVDARSGFAYPAIDVSVEALTSVIEDAGIAAACIHHSHHIGQAGMHVERLADEGLLALIFSNSPKAIAFWGSGAPMMGTNPIAFAAPVAGEAPLVIDLALSKVARGKILAAQQRGETIPEGWAVDASGEPTTNPDAAMAGAMLPIGDAKGAALVLMVELLAAALTGAQFGFEASSFFSGEGEPPHIGHTLLVIDPDRASGGAFSERMKTITSLIDRDSSTRLPGTTRLSNRAKAAAEGIRISATLHTDIVKLAE